jgi:hypothetical protein
MLFAPPPPGHLPLAITLVKVDEEPSEKPGSLGDLPVGASLREEKMVTPIAAEDEDFYRAGNFIPPL